MGCTRLTACNGAWNCILLTATVDSRGEGEEGEEEGVGGGGDGKGGGGVTQITSGNSDYKREWK